MKCLLRKTAMFSFLLLAVLIVKAQEGAVGVGTNTPNSSAILDITASKKGVLIPRINLINVTDQVTIPNPAQSLLVFNTNPNITGGNGMGFYYWSGTTGTPANQWLFLASGNSSSATGAKIYTGNGIPVLSEGNQGDLYVDNVTGDYYQKDASNIWGLRGNLKGPKGDTGAQGLQGTQGATGAAGVDGKDGKDGATGPQGIQGVKGDVGATGATGAQGLQGIQGATGATGVDGKDGKDGATGPQGIQGMKGDVGATGVTGAQGLQGIQGVPGTAGADGKDGKDGAQGIQGVKGDIGATGATGIQGLQGIQGAMGATGAAGADGKDGATGAQGIQGVKGDIGATGATGSTGLQGATGMQGLQGIQGVTGATGAQGIQGVKGDIGATGATGLQGPIGLTGATGAQGIQGMKGDIGATGATGLQGATGSTGAAGADGKDGATGVQGGIGLIINGTNTTVTGAGTSASPYQINTPTTTLTQNTTTGVITYTNETGTASTAKVVSTNAGNLLAVGSDGGAMLNASALPVSITANNGLAATGSNVQLGGALIQPTTVTTDAANTLALAGLQPASPTGTDNIVVANSSTGVLKTLDRSLLNNWHTTGNAGTIATTTSGNNFIGTTDNVALDFRVANMQVGWLGYQVLGGGTSSVYFGINAGLAGAASTNGTFANIGIGEGALAANTTNGNVAVGTFALTKSVSGINNVAIGLYPLLNNTTGASNIGIGPSALQNNTAGSTNIALGANAGTGNTTGSNNMFIGAYADASAAALTNATAIGNNAKVATSNSLILGGTGAYAVNVGIGTAAPTATLDVAGTARIETLPSGTVSDSLVTVDPAGNLHKRSAYSPLVIVPNWTVSYTVQDNDYVIIYGNSGGIVNLPAITPAMKGRMLIIRGTSTGVVTVQPAASQYVYDNMGNLNGSVTTNNAGITLIANGVTSWYQLP